MKSSNGVWAAAGLSLGLLVHFEVISETTALFLAIVGVAVYFGDKFDRLNSEIEYLKTKIVEED